MSLLKPTPSLASAMARSMLSGTTRRPFRYTSVCTSSNPTERENEQDDASAPLPIVINGAYVCPRPGCTHTFTSRHLLVVHTYSHCVPMSQRRVSFTRDDTPAKFQERERAALASLHNETNTTHFAGPGIPFRPRSSSGNNTVPLPSNLTTNLPHRRPARPPLPHRPRRLPRNRTSSNKENTFNTPPENEHEWKPSPQPKPTPKPKPPVRPTPTVVVPGEKKRFKCPHCDFTNERWSHIERHLPVHDGRPRPYACSFSGCTARYALPGPLVLHERKHVWPSPEDSKKFACPFAGCESRFGRKYDCDEHYRTHLGERYPCTFPGCDSSYSRERDMKRHYDEKHKCAYR